MADHDIEVNFISFRLAFAHIITMNIRIILYSLKVWIVRITFSAISHFVHINTIKIQLK
jgi:hypothetical protein